MFPMKVLKDQSKERQGRILHPRQTELGFHARVGTNGTSDIKHSMEHGLNSYQLNITVSA